MSVFKKRDTFHYDFWLKGHRYLSPAGFATQRKAEAAQAAAREAASLRHARGEAPPTAARAPKVKGKTLHEAANEWWTLKGQMLGREHDEDFRLSRLTRAVELVGKDKLVLELRTANIAEAIQKRRAKLVKPPGVKGRGHVPANATVNRDIIETIRPVIYHACALLDVSPPPIKWGDLRMKTPKPKARDFADDAMEAFYDELPEHWRDFARFEASYGARVGEMFFHPKDIEVGRQQVTLRDRKADDDLVLPLLPDDAAMLAARKSRALAAGLDTVWFRQLKGGRIKALKRSSAVWAVRKAVRAAGLRGAKGTHDLRHHAAMQMLRETGNLRSVQNLLGHADIKSTTVYAHALKHDVLKGLEAVAAARKSRQGPAAEKATAADTNENKAVGE
jgi:integrase